MARTRVCPKPKRPEKISGRFAAFPIFLRHRLPKSGNLPCGEAGREAFPLSRSLPDFQTRKCDLFWVEPRQPVNRRG